MSSPLRRREAATPGATARRSTPTPPFYLVAACDGVPTIGTPAPAAEWRTDATLL
jgi:hypothetical protein